MSFQGDVAGIGLGELLQGLARGGRDGVLTLYGTSSSAAIGLRRSRLYVLASPDEDPSRWRERCQRAWAKDPDPQLEGQRREKIARAARLETVYQMLEAGNLHFRFEQGPLPLHPGEAPKDDVLRLDAGPNAPTDAEMERAWGQGFTVEYLLLEHARISDESKSGPAATLSSWDLPRALDPAKRAPGERDFLVECDGNSTLLEIADRLGWTLTQCRHTAGEYLRQEAIRIAQPRELLAASQRELEHARAGRAAARIEGWQRATPSGPPPVEEANLLVGEWDKGRLVHVLPYLPRSVARALLRRLDSVHEDPRASRDRWHALCEIARSDQIVALRTATTRFALVRDPEARAFHDLLKLARTFQQDGHSQRAAMLLRLASSRMPSRLQTRVELGKRMLESELVEEGTRWLLDTARELIAQGDTERAVAPLRTVLRFVPEESTANGLLLQTLAIRARRKRRRWQTASLLSFGVVLGLVGVVRLHTAHVRDRKLHDIEALIDQPDLALQLLDSSFGGDPSERIGQLRSQITVLKKEAEARQYAKWLVSYDAANEQASYGDLLSGLESVLALPSPPDADVDTQDVRHRSDLFGILARRLTDRSKELDLPPDATEGELQQEADFIVVLEKMLARIDPNQSESEESLFRFKLAELRDSVVTRRQERAKKRSELLERMRQKDQSVLLSTARSNRDAGNLERAMQAYDLLIERDPDLKKLGPFQTEVGAVRQQLAATRKALELAQEGRHDEARAVIFKELPDPGTVELPWHVDSRPQNARVTLANGRVKVTPFVMKSAFGQLVQFTLVADGYVPRTVTLDAPRDLVVNLYRAPERVWDTTGVVDAAPVAVGDDHVLCDRLGNVRRIHGDSSVEWEVHFDTLGGIARTPIFLAGQAGHLLMLSEDGQAWIVDAGNGEAEGPYEIGSPPVKGPTMTRGGVSARFADGRVALWSDGLDPEFFEAEGLVAAPDDGDDSGIERTSTTVRITSSSTTSLDLESPWTHWTVKVLPREFLVRTPDGRGFSAERTGPWHFVMWEAPKALVPNGRLWVSDGTGVRSYLPLESFLVPLGSGAAEASSGSAGKPSGGAVGGSDH